MIQGDLFQETVEERFARAVSLHQPWASLIAAGVKTVETRGWKTPRTLLGERILIHAARTDQGMKTAVEIPELWEACLESLPWDKSGGLPFGCLVASARVTDCKPVEDLEADCFGDYTPGRFGWILEDVEALETPIPYRGGQGVFIVNLP